MGLNFIKSTKKIDLKVNTTKKSITTNCALKRLTPINKSFLKSLGFKINHGYIGSQ